MEQGNKLGFRQTMEQQEKRKRRQISSSSKSTVFIPHHVASEILSKLPAKSLMRFRCVSKLWSSITTDTYFINMFQTQSTKKRPCLLLCFRRSDKLFVFSLPQDHHHKSNAPYSIDSISSQPVDSYHMTCPKQRSYFSADESVHGLISCFPGAAKPVMWNPTMRKFLTLPKPNLRKGWNPRRFILGYDPIEGKHKILCIPHGKTLDECQVLTLGSAQESWRTVKTNHTHCIDSLAHHQCINGVLYYKAYVTTGYHVKIIMSFDVKSEKFHMINLPCSTGTLTPYEGRLAWVTGNGEGGTTMWILRDAEKHGWSSKNFPAPFYKDIRRERRNFHFIGITDAGEFIYVPYTIHKPFYVFYHDPERNMYHRVEYKGIADDEFRLKNGLGERPLDNIKTVLHKETLMSL